MGLFDFFRRVRGTGWHPDAPDRRDVPLGQLLGQLALVTAAPSSFTLRHPAVTPRDQGAAQSCVGFAWAQALELAYAHRGLLTGDLSPAFLYFLARASHGAAGVDAGTYLRAAAKAVARFGCAAETTDPYSVRRINQSPAWTAYRDAFDRRGLRGYFRADPFDLDAIRSAISSGHPIVGGWQVDQAFVDLRGGDIIYPIRGEPLGGHAIAVVGYRADDTFEILNSWGTGWGNGGYALVTGSFIQQGSDLWAIDVEAPS